MQATIPLCVFHTLVTRHCVHHKLSNMQLDKSYQNNPSGTQYHLLDSHLHEERPYLQVKGRGLYMFSFCM